MARISPLTTSFPVLWEVFQQYTINEVHAITASQFSEVCSIVTVKPTLQLLSLTGEQLQAHLNLSPVWNDHFKNTIFETRVFNPLAKSNTVPGTFARNVLLS